MKKQYKEPPFTIVNGRKRYSFRCEVMGEFRPPVPPAQTPPPTPQQLQNQQNAQAAGEGGTAPGEPSDDIARTRVRVLSNVFTWSGTYFGPQLVDNGANNAYALRKMVDIINSRTGSKAVPVVWDHSLEAKDIFGRLANGAWEDSTDIPPGVNADIEVPRSVFLHAAGLIDEDMLPATSVWWCPSNEKSHPDMPFGEFMERQGEIVDGKTVCWLPVDLTDDQLIHHAVVWAERIRIPARREEQNLQNAADAAPHTHSEGDRGMEEQLRKMVETIANALGINVALGPGSAIPDTLEKRVTDGITTLRGVQGQYNELAGQLQTIGTSLLKQGETTLSATDVLNRLPERIAMAKHGEAFLKNQQALAVAWLNKAKVDPTKAETLSDVDKREAERLSNCADLQLLEDRVTMYQNEAKARFGPTVNMRSSQGEDITPPNQPAGQKSATDVQIEAEFAWWNNSYQGVNAK